MLAAPSRRDLRGEGKALLLPHAVHTGTMVARFTSRSYAVAENVYLTGAISHDHSHESPFIVVSLGGQALPVIRGTERMLTGPGTLTMIPAGWDHSPTVLSTAQCMTIDIRSDCAEQLIELGADFSKLHLFPDAGVQRYGRQLADEIRHPDPFSTLQVEALIIEICASLMRLSRRDESATAPRWLRRVMTRIEECFKEEYSLEDLAAEVEVHPVHVARVFRRCYGETPGEYTRRLRIKEARRLLEYSSRSLAEIAVEVGYHDQSHFSRAFEKVVGTTPGRYRRIVRASAKAAL
jgi:AraC family transcriptional regulator